ncbi:MAG: hypothetical protein AAGA68_16595 [Pseudomonadota bacterium]
MRHGAGGEGGAVGQGEGMALFYRPETAQSLAAQIEALAPDLTDRTTRRDLLGLLPANGARCALDAALWALETEQTGVPAWRRAGPESMTATLLDTAV